MGRRITKARSAALVWLMIVGAIVGSIIKVAESIGAATLIVVTACILGLHFWSKRKRHADRLKHLMDKYQNEELVSKIMSGYFWEGQTSEQLMGSIGQPIEVDDKYLKTKHKQVWKYNRNGHNRYGLRITLENGIVVGWDKKAS